MEQELTHIVDQGMDPEKSGMERETPDPVEQRRALVSSWQDRVTRARTHWEKKAFRQMKADQKFAAGDQWPAQKMDHLADENEDRYVANITLRHIKTETAEIYGKNPQIVARRKERLLNTVWDGSMHSLRAAIQTLQSGVPDMNALALVQDAQQSMKINQQMDKIAQTLKLLFDHSVSEQNLPFKVQMKATVRKALTNGVSYVKLGYQRIMEKSPDVEQKLHDMSQQLSTIERLSADLQDGEVDENSKEAEQLRLAMNALAEQKDVLVREGLLFSYPASTAVIPDLDTKQLRGFIGSQWVAEEYYFTGDKIKELYNIDPGAATSSARHYCENASGHYTPDDNTNRDGKEMSESFFCVWEIYNKVDGLVYTMCDGHKDFLKEPTQPPIWMERFYPWFTLVFNEVENDTTIYPPSDVFLMRNMQLDLNRARQGLREHRRANRPKTFVRSGALEEADKDNIMACEANAVIVLNGMQPQEKIEEILQPHQGPTIDPNLYDTRQAYEDIMRTLGKQEANLGGTSGATATEVATAEGSRSKGNSATVDDLDEFLTEVARAGGQILLRETTEQTVKEVVGPGAVWPELSRDDIAKEIYLDVEAASTGRPNQAQEIQNAQQLFPLLMQIPGMDPEWMARELIRRLGDRIDLADAFASQMPSITQMNSQTQAPTGDPGSDPNQQGPEGSQNGQNPEAPQVNAAPRTAVPGQQY